MLHGVSEYIILLFYYVSALTTREYCEIEMSVTLGQRIVVRGNISTSLLYLSDDGFDKNRNRSQ